MSICENGQNARWRAMRTSYPPLTTFSTLPSTGSPAWNASSSSRCVAAFRTPLRDSVDTAAGRHDHRLNSVADRDLERAVGVLQLRDIDLRLALAADVDERHLRAERDDGALDGLATLESAGLDGRLEHCREIFLLAHFVLLETVTLLII